MKIYFTAAAVPLLCTVALGQRFSFGVLGGAPLSETSRSGITDSRAGYGPWYFDTRPYTIGPTFEFALPLPSGLSVEVDGLYKRVDTENHYFFSPLFGMIVREKGNSWEFSMLLKYRWRRRLRPFVSAGGSFRHIAGFDASQETFAYGLNPPYSVVYYRANAPLTQGGIAAGAGLTLWRAGPLKFEPQLRYTRWTSLRYFPAQNQVEFLLGLKL